MASWYVIATMFLDSGNEYLGSGPIRHPTRLYDGRVKQWGIIDRSISTPSGIPEISDAKIRLIDTDRKWHDLLAHQTPRRRFMELKIIEQGASESATLPCFTGEITDFDFGPGYAEVTLRDRTYAWIDEEIPNTVTRSIFPELANSDEGFLPIVFGQKRSNPLNPQGVIALPHISYSVAHGDRWGAAIHTVWNVVGIYRKQPGEGIFTPVDPGEYNVDVEPIVIEGVSYDATFIDFILQQPDGTEIRADIDGIDFRPAFGTLPALTHSDLTGPLRNPIDFFIVLTQVFLRRPGPASNFDTVGIVALHSKFATGPIIDSSSSTGFDPYYCDHAITESIVARAELARFCTSFQVDLLQTRDALTTLNFTDESDSSQPLFTEGRFIKRDSFFEKIASPTLNQIRYRFDQNVASGEWGSTEVYNNTADQLTVGDIERDSSGDPVLDSAGDPIRTPRIESDVFDLYCVADPLTAADVTARRASFMALGSYRQTWTMPTPEVLDDVELAALAFITTHWGLETGGYVAREIKIIGISIDLDGQEMTVRSILRVPQTVEPPTPPIDVEAPIEILDEGIAGRFSFYTPFSGGPETARFARSEFTFNPALYGGETTFTFEAIVTNDSYSLSRHIYIERMNIERPLDGPVVVFTMEVPAQTFKKRIRYETPWTTFASRTEKYRVSMQKAAPFTGFPAGSGLPDRSIYPAPAILPSATFELEKLRLIAYSQNARRAIIEFPMTTYEHDPSENDVFESAFVTTEGEEIDIPGSAIFRYIAAAWDRLEAVRLVATMSIVDGAATCSLFDITDSVIVGSVELIGPALPSTVTETFAPTVLTDGHEYVVQLKSEGEGGAPAEVYTAHFYKARLQMIVNPAKKLNVYWRYAIGDDNEESRILYAPELNTHLQGISIEVTGQDSGVGLYETKDEDVTEVTEDGWRGIPLGETAHLPGWFGYFQGDHIPAQNYTVNVNMATVVAQYVAVKNADLLTLDYIDQAKQRIRWAAWQYEMFEAQLNVDHQASVNEINALRDEIIAGMEVDREPLVISLSDSSVSTDLTFDSTKSRQELDLSDDALTTGRRYFGIPAASGPVWSQIAGTAGINSSWVTDGVDSRQRGAVMIGTTLYAGFNQIGAGSQVWALPSGGAWSKVGGDALNGSWANTGTPKKFIQGLATDGTNLYVALGTDTDGGAEVYKFVPTGPTWTKIGQTSSWSGGSYQTVFSVLVISGTLYASLGFGSTDGTVWQYSGAGTSWTKIGGNGVNSGWTTGNGIEIVFCLENYNGNLVAGLGFGTGDGEVWKFATGSWTKIGGDGVNSSWTKASVDSLVGNGTDLHAVVAGKEVWSFNGSTWSQNADGIGLNGSDWFAASIVAIYEGKLLVGVGSTLTFASPAVWQFDAGAWTQIAGDSINGTWGDIEPDNVPGIDSLVELSGVLYVGLGMGSPVQFATTDGVGDMWMFG